MKRRAFVRRMAFAALATVFLEVPLPRRFAVDGAKPSHASLVAPHVRFVFDNGTAVEMTLSPEAFERMAPLVVGEWYDLDVDFVGWPGPHPQRALLSRVAYAQRGVHTMEEMRSRLDAVYPGGVRYEEWVGPPKRTVFWAT